MHTRTRVTGIQSHLQCLWQALDAIEKLSEEEINDAMTQGMFENRKYAILGVISHNKWNADMSETLRTINTDKWAIPSAKSDGEAEEKLESCT